MLIGSDRHAHDVLVGGQKFVADLQRRLEPDEADWRASITLAMSIVSPRSYEAERSLAVCWLWLTSLSAFSSVAAKPVGLLSSTPVAGGGRIGAGERLVALEDLRTQRHHPIDADRAAADSADRAHADTR